MIAEQRVRTVSFETKKGWLVVVASLVGVAVGSSPIPFYTIGMFAPELSRAFGWSFASIMAAIAVQSVTVIFASPVAGRAVDRFGARPIALGSLMLFGLAFMSFGLGNGSLWLFYAQWVMMAIAGSGTLSGTWTRVVNGWFDRNRGLALGLASTGTGLTGILIKPLGAWLILSFGWRAAFFAIGLLPIVIGMPIVAWLFRERDEALVSPDKRAPTDYGIDVRQALRQPRFWIMAVAFLLISFALTAPTPNLENILRSLKFDVLTIAKITGSFGLAVIVGRISGGWLIDRIWAPACACIFLILPAIGLCLLSRPTSSMAAAFGAVAALGLAAGFEFDLLAFLVNRYFGQRHYGAIYGCFYAVIATGGGAGPVVFGYAFDRTGSYGVVLVVGALCLVVGGAVLLLMGPYPRWDADDEAENPRPLSG